MPRGKCWDDRPPAQADGFELQLKPVIPAVRLAEANSKPVPTMPSQEIALLLATKINIYRLKAGGLLIPKGDSKYKFRDYQSTWSVPDELPPEQ